MKHQTKRKYVDRKKLNRKYHSQKAYRKEQKRKTGWRARLDKFTDRLVNVFMIFSLTMGFLKMVSTVCGNLKIISLPYHMKMVQREVSVIGILFKMEMSSLKMHALMILNA